MMSCGSLPSKSNIVPSKTPQSSHTSTMASSTSTTLALYPQSTSFARLCSAYYLVSADNYLSVAISATSKSEITPTQNRYDSSVQLLAKSSITQNSPLSHADLSALKNVNFSAIDASRPPSTSLGEALSDLTSSFDQLCQPIKPVATVTSALLSQAQQQGMSSACESSSTELQSSADLSYAIVEATPPASLSSTSCFINDSNGILERVDGSDAAPVETYYAFPCGQAPPAILLSLFGPHALDVCYPTK